MREVRRVRPIAFTAIGWDDFAADVLRQASRAAAVAGGARG